MKKLPNAAIDAGVFSFYLIEQTTTVGIVLQQYPNKFISSISVNMWRLVF